jgi:hypothetical protein
MLHQKPDLVFIDGMHLFEFALRDFINVEKHSSPSTLVVIDDIFPCHPTQAKRRRKSGSWTGDVWKLQKILEQARPDLTLIKLNSYTTGLILICGLDPDNETLEREYVYWVDRYIKDVDLPVNVLSRYGVIPSGSPVVAEIIKKIKYVNQTDLTISAIRHSLSQLDSKLDETQKNNFGRAEDLAGTCLLENASTPVGECKGSTEIQIYFPQTSTPIYRESSSKKFRLSTDGTSTVIQAIIPLNYAYSNHPLRIDPCGQPGIVLIEKLILNLVILSVSIYFSPTTYCSTQTA